MKICYFGTYENTYPRNRIIINGLKKNGVEVIECHADLWRLEDDKTKIFKLYSNTIKLPFKLLFSSFLLLYRYIRKGCWRCQFIIVGYPAHLDIFLAYMLSVCMNQQLVFNPLISFYDTLINDRKLFKKTSFVARSILWLEKNIFRLPKVILLDTSTHILLLKKILNIPDKIKLVRVFVGADENIFKFTSYHKPKSTLEISFIGKFTPLHGLPTIIKAAKLLEKNFRIHFTIVGRGQLSEEIRTFKKRFKLKNVTFISWIPYQQLSDVINNSDICLGIFDSGEKAQSVIPNKIYEAVAMGKPVITCSTSAVNELFEDNKNIILCPTENPEYLAKKILFLQSHPTILKEIGLEARSLFEKKLTESKIGQDVKTTLELLLQR